MIIVVGLTASSIVAGEHNLALGNGQAVVIRRVADGLETKDGREIQGMRAVISQITFTPSESSPRSFVVSGKVVSDNTGTGIERVLIRVGEESAIPAVAGMTNVDGEFKFRLWIDEDDRRPGPEVKEPFKGYLYVGGQVADLDVKEPSGIGSNVRRYRLSQLFAHASKNKEREQGGGGDGGKPSN